MWPGLSGSDDVGMPDTFRSVARGHYQIALPGATTQKASILGRLAQGYRLGSTSKSRRRYQTSGSSRSLARSGSESGQKTVSDNTSYMRRYTAHQNVRTLQNISQLHSHWPVLIPLKSIIQRYIILRFVTTIPPST